jgi:thiol:disulfide interchange protein DsbD
MFAFFREAIHTLHRRHPAPDPFLYHASIMNGTRISNVWRSALLTVCGLLGSGAPALGTADPALAPASVATDNVKARLISEVSSISPGQAFWVALDLDIRDGWHTYWRNPGDSGQATALQWTLPPGFSAGEIQWATPHRFELPPLVNFGYAKHAVHLVRIEVPQDLAPGTTARLETKASWLVCADLCIPENAALGLSLPVVAGPPALDPGHAALFASARSDLPVEAPAPTNAAVQGGKLMLTLGPGWGTTLQQIKTLSFFPFEDGAIEYAAPQILTRNGDSLQLTVKAGYQPPTSGAVRGLLVATLQDGATVSTVPLRIEAVLPGGGGATLTAPRYAAAAAVGAAAPPTRDAAAAAPRSELGLAAVLALAVLGGLILNLMPCVFPVLSIKAIGLVEQARKHPAAVRAKGVVFAAGVITSLLALAGVLLMLRAGGEQIGWGFQLQSPLFVTLMIYLLLAVGLNLSGVFEIGGGLAGLGDGLTQGDSYHAAFFTGVLTTLVATPCTAPFMAAAVGWALTQPPLVALSIFAALGAGLSLPYLLLCFAPWLRRALPKPGAWMDTLKQLFAFPMYASAAWLLWVLAQQTAAIGLAAALAGAVLIGLAAWAYQRSKTSRARPSRWASLVTAAAALGVALALPLQFAHAPPTPLAAARSAGGADAEGWQAYDPVRLEQLRAAGQPVLVNFTASWCLTCLVNERNAFADASVQEIFRGKGVTLMKGDWTNRDPAITKALAAFGRAGVPLYVVYNAQAGSTAPIVLPQLLSVAIVREVFAGKADRVAANSIPRN